MENAGIADLLKNAGFRFSKALGQNFIFDGNLLDAVASDGGVESTDTVVEIGTGAGTLTARLAARAKKVYSFEVDERLKSVLDVTLQGADLPRRHENERRRACRDNRRRRVQGGG